MTRRVRAWHATRAALAALLLLVAPWAFASSEDETVYCADPATNQILKVEFDDDTTEVVNTDASLRRRLGGIAVRSHVDDGGRAEAASLRKWLLT